MRLPMTRHRSEVVRAHIGYERLGAAPIKASRQGQDIETREQCSKIDEWIAQADRSSIDQLDPIRRQKDMIGLHVAVHRTAHSAVENRISAALDASGDRTELGTRPADVLDGARQLLAYIAGEVILKPRHV